METFERACEPLISPRVLAQRLQTLRLRAGWKLEEVADRAGISRSTLYYLERGFTPHPRAATIHRLAEAYGVQVELLIASSDTVTMRRSTATVQEGLDHWSGAEHGASHPGDSLSAACRFDRATNPAVEAVAASDPQLFSGWCSGDWDELYSSFGTGGALNEEGVRQLAIQINRQRDTLQRLRVILQTHLADVVTEMIDALFRKICPHEEARPVGAPGESYRL